MLAMDLHEESAKVSSNSIDVDLHEESNEVQNADKDEEDPADGQNEKSNEVQNVSKEEEERFGDS